ncbi:MAG TPA: glycosyltransferase family 2 protein [Bacillaceae bacterium]|nr:glycosyltransferase family 2 protein [Bacillaceae bacterium]
MNKLAVTFVIPTFNEEQSIDAIYEAIKTEMEKQTFYRFELLFIDDGSTDNTLELIKEKSTHCKEVKYISFTRNFGKESSILAGLKYAKGDAVIMMDADLQHPPSLIGELLHGFEEGYEQVVAKRDRKGDSKIRSFMSSIYYHLVNKVVDVELSDGEGDFRLLSRRAVESLLSLDEGNRFSKGLYSWIGYEAKIIQYKNNPRKNGDSKWSFAKLLNYGIDGVISFNNRPLRLCFFAGLWVLLLALLYVVYIFIQIVQRGISVPGYFTLISAVLIIGGIQLICLGIIGEYIGRIYFETKKRPHYIVKKSNVVDDSNVFKRYGKSVSTSPPYVFEHEDSIPEKELVVEHKTSTTTK